MIERMSEKPLPPLPLKTSQQSFNQIIQIPRGPLLMEPSRGVPRFQKSRLPLNIIEKLRGKTRRKIHQLICLLSVRNPPMHVKQTANLISIFQEHDLYQIKRTLSDLAPAIYEYREIYHAQLGIPCSSGLYLERLFKDIQNMKSLKITILKHCRFIDEEIVEALADQPRNKVRATQIDIAFWRIWTFCRIFRREDTFSHNLSNLTLRNYVVEVQKNWINGISTPIRDTDLSNNIYNFTAFGFGNPGGLSERDLSDMIEVWKCFDQLICLVRGNNSEIMARNYEYTTSNSTSLSFESLLETNQCLFRRLDFLV